jgi:hypothetical protein
MAVTFITTLGAEDATSLVTLDQAAQYFEDTSESNFANWNTLSEDNKKRALNSGTAYLCDNYCFFGALRNVRQALCFPRSGFTAKDGRYYDTDITPKEVIAAICELGIRGFDFSGATPVENPLIPDQSRTIKKASIDGVGDVEYESGSTTPRIFNEVDDMLNNIVMCSRSSSNSIVKFGMV